MMQEDVLFGVEEDVTSEEVAEVKTEKYLLFLSDGLLFGVPAEAVVEIITSHAVTWLPLVPDYVRGIINLRGQIIPIVDIRRYMDYPDMDSDCMIILQAEGNEIGILVDQVQRMVDIDVSSIVSDSSHDSGKLVSGMCSLDDGQTMLVFDCTRLVEHA